MTLKDTPEHQKPLHQLIDPDEAEEIRRTSEELAAEAEQQRRKEQKARHELLTGMAAEQLASIMIHDVEAAAACGCSCHPRPADPDVHGGEVCSCQQTAEENAARMAKLFEDIQNLPLYDDSDDRRAIMAAAETLGCTLEEAGGIAPYQIIGQADGVRFYLRERGGHWTLSIPDDEAGDLGDPTGVENGRLIIAEGTENDLYVAGRPEMPLVCALDAVRRHLLRRSCAHPDARAWCPDCGAPMARGAS